MIEGDDKRSRPAHRSRKLCNVVETQSLMTPRQQHTVDGLGPETGDAKQLLAAGFVHVDGKAIAMPQSPGKLGIDVEIKHAVGKPEVISSVSKP